MNFKERISLQFTNLTKTDKRIINILLKSPNYLIDNSVQEAAALIETSPAALVRLAKKIGYKGLPDFKISLEEYFQEGEASEAYSDKSLITNVVDNYRHNLNLVESQLDEEQLERVSQLLISSSNIKILGIGSSGLSAEQMVYFLLYQDKYAESVTSKTKIYYLSRNLKKEDVLIFYTVSGNKDYQEIFNAAQKVGCTTVVITMDDKRELRELASEFILLPSNLSLFLGDSQEIYQLDNRSMFLIFSEILAAYVNKNMK
ncbi:MurR/RpiR family transcriptional regulator [Streptococcus dentasini]